MHRYSFKINVHDKADKSGLVQIYLSGSINGQSYKIYTGQKIPQSSFDEKKERVKALHGVTRERARVLNTMLKNFEAKARGIFDDAMLCGEPLSLNEFKGAMATKQRIGVYEFLEAAIEERILAPETLKIYKVTLSLLIEVYGRKAMPQDFADLPERAEKLMLKKNHSFNTRQKYHSKLKTLMKIARKGGFKVGNPYEDWKIHRIEGNRQFLEIGEVLKLIALYQEHDLEPHIRNTLACFLFSCYTGIRHSDIGELTHKNIMGQQLHFYPRKTQRLSKKMILPLADVAYHLVQNRNGRLFKPVSTQHMNRNLAQIMDFLNIRKHITFHCARHTFGTVFIALGGELTVLRELMGHSKIETTLIYVKMADGLKKRQITLFDDAFAKEMRVIVRNVSG